MSGLVLWIEQEPPRMMPVRCSEVDSIGGSCSQPILCKRQLPDSGSTLHWQRPQLYHPQRGLCYQGSAIEPQHHGTYWHFPTGTGNWNQLLGSQQCCSCRYLEWRQRQKANGKTAVVRSKAQRKVEGVSMYAYLKCLLPHHLPVHLQQGCHCCVCWSLWRREKGSENEG